MPGHEGFKTKAAAEKVARLAIEKMKKGESLLTIGGCTTGRVPHYLHY
jgi:hypothetical protein